MIARFIVGLLACVVFAVVPSLSYSFDDPAAAHTTQVSMRSTGVCRRSARPPAPVTCAPLFF